MAVNKGIVDIKGKIGGLSFYTLNGKSVVRVSYGPDKQRIMSDSSYVRMRENMSEFGGASFIAKVFRSRFSSSVNMFGESYLSGRLTALMKKVCSLSSGKRGERSFEFSIYKKQLEGFEFNKSIPLNKSFSAPFNALEINADRTVVRLKIPRFDSDSYINAPEGSTHFKLILSSDVLSDFVFDTRAKRYVPVYTEHTSLNACDVSDFIALGSSVVNDIELVTDFGISEVLPGSMVVIAVFGIVFYKESNSEFYELAEGKGMCIIGVK